MGNSFYFEFEPVLMEWLQKHLGETGCNIFSQFTWFGEPVVLILVFGFLYWCYDKKFAIYVASVSMVGVVANPLIKNVVLRKRPYMVHEEIKCLRPVEKSADIYDISAQGYSFPSGHSMNSAILYGAIAKYTKKAVFIFLAFLLPFLVGFSRIVVGVHYPTDVITGWITGVLFIYVFSFIYEKVGEEKRTLLNLIIFAVFSIGFFYCRTTDYFTGMGTMAGFYLAIEFEKRFVRFEETRKPLEAVLRISGGFIIYVGLNKLLKLPFSNELLESQTIGAFMIRFFRYAIILFVLTGVYPIIFNKFKKERVNEAGATNERS